ncbi:endonuclease III [Candidatus Kaiserbacteria bacterium]|nr:MAG: endonuclease III [Candidatus Kaiserbacteria bacterium]
MQKERKERMAQLTKALKRMYPEQKTELNYATQFQLVVAVMLSAQCTDKKVNECTQELFKKYKIPKDFAQANPVEFEKQISSVTFYRNKTKHVIAAAKLLVADFDGEVPQSISELILLPGVAYKTANVVLGELYGIWEGIATDTHVRRFALRFDLTDNKELTKISKGLEALVPKKDWRYINNGFVLYGRYICSARPHDCVEHTLTKIWPKAVNVWPKAK